MSQQQPNYEGTYQQPQIIDLKTPWTRSQEGIIAGVCAGVARRLQVDPWLVRIALLLSVFALGFGIALYIVLAICLPREDQVQQASQRRILGVCARLSKSLDVDVGLLRAAAVLLALSSFGATVLAYLVLHFVVPAHPPLRQLA